MVEIVISENVWTIVLAAIAVSTISLFVNFLLLRLALRRMIKVNRTDLISEIVATERRWESARLFKAHKHNLSGANLSGLDLTGADFRGFDFTKTNFNNANLSYADLSRADLRDANLKNANLKGATLVRASVDGAVFDKATLPDQAFFHWKQT